MRINLLRPVNEYNKIVKTRFNSKNKNLNK